MSYTPELLINNKNNYPDEPAISNKIDGKWVTDTWLDYYNLVLSISKSLIACGINADDKGSIYSYNRKKWFGCYSALQLVNGVSVGVYHTSSANEVEWVVGNSDSKIVFVGNNPNDNDEKEKMPIHRLMSVIDNLNQVNTIVLMGDDIDIVDHDKVITWDEFINKGKDVKEQSILDMLNNISADGTTSLIYTSGTTGLPKGVVRDNGGHAVALKYSMKAVFNSEPGDVYWAGSDVGWVVGHSYIVYAPLIHGCTTVLYEGKPVKTPDAGSFWRIISEHQVNTFFTAPTAFRAVKKEDPTAKLKDKYDIGCLRYLFLAGERLDPPTYEWLTEILEIPVIDHWWQTESGWPMCSNMMGLEPYPVKIGSPTFPVPGYNVKILDDEGESCQPGETGNIVVKLPLPPSCFPTLWNDDKRFRDSYLSKYPGYYLTGDGGLIDKDGYVYVMGRVDDVINVAGHRLSTGQMEELIASHPAVAECAVVGIDDELRGQIPVGFAVLKDGINISQDQLEQEMVSIIRKEIGAVAYFRQSVIVSRLPKTRSGKILRKTIRQLAKGEDVPAPPTIDDPAILKEICQVMESCGVGSFASK